MINKVQEVIKPHPPISLLLFLQSAPPKLTFEAFIRDCKVCGMPWYSPAAQQYCVALLIRNPLLKKYPPRKVNVRAFLKYYVSQLELPEISLCITELSESDEDDIIDAQLMEAFIEHSINVDAGNSNSLCYKTFYISNISHPSFVSVRLSAEQFNNVGLSLWPAAFIMIQLLIEDAKRNLHIFLPEKGEINFLELGAGVGLTPSVLCNYNWYRERVRSFVVTDYQQELIDNIEFNLKINKVIGGTSSSSIKINNNNNNNNNNNTSINCNHIVDILDWTEDKRNAQKLREWGSNVILAADCIYDVDVIEPLVKTIYQALHNTNNAVAIVVQTHRQNKTMKYFFDAVRGHQLHVCSYRLIPDNIIALIEKKNNNNINNNNLLYLYSNIQSDSTLPRKFALVQEDIGPDGGFDTKRYPLENRSNSSSNNTTTKNNNIDNNNCWVGSFFIQSEAVVGVHVLRLKSQ